VVTTVFSIFTESTATGGCSCGTRRTIEDITWGAGFNLTIHSSDALKFDFSSLALAGEKLHILGNLPYNISTPLMFHLLENTPRIL
jgi:16S rRNA A1518/A1519 N6-dimethyltransferase RsmA/KsgA/DIM1 with predicted DNA glycosylase/AP lyase activity